MSTIQEKINELRKKHNVLILSHFYQPGDVQDIADMVGDSYGLAKKSAETNADVVVFCGVLFMAESAKILNPEKTVILPDLDAGCPMADMATAEDVKALKARYPEAAVVCYVNTSAEVKAECDVCCTSSNAVNIVNNLKEKQVVFLPDVNLGGYVGAQCPDKEMILYDGYCPVHHLITAEEILAVKAQYPDALFLVHPECKKEVADLADFVGSTAQIIRYATESSHQQFIIGTEEGILHELKRQNPDKEFIVAANGFVCADMKKVTLEDVLHSLEDLDAGKDTYTIMLDPDIISRSRKSLDRMLEIGG